MKKPIYYFLLIVTLLFNLLVIYLLFKAYKQPNGIDCVSINIKDNYMCLSKSTAYIALAFGGIAANVLWFNKKRWLGQ